jgi:hypothetical protein
MESSMNHLNSQPSTNPSAHSSYGGTADPKHDPVIPAAAPKIPYNNVASTCSTLDMHSVLFSIKERNSNAFAFWIEFFGNSVSVPSTRFAEALVLECPDNAGEYTSLFDGFTDVDPQVFSILLNGKLAGAFKIGKQRGR